MARITVANTYRGTHHWPKAEGVVEFLRNKHAHDFKVSISCDVRHNDREIEFYILRNRLDDIVLKGFPQEYGFFVFDSMGCEQVGTEVLKQLLEMYPGRNWVVEVWEDSNQGAVVAEECLEVVSDITVEEYTKIADKAKSIFAERMSSYGNSVNEIDVHTIVGLMRMKLYRIYQEGLTPKAEDELLDTINYAIFALSRIKKGSRND